MKKIYLTLVSSLLIMPTLLNAITINSTNDNTATVPEPSIIALLGVGVAAVLLIKKFKK